MYIYIHIYKYTCIFMLLLVCSEKNKTTFRHYLPISQCVKTFRSENADLFKDHFILYLESEPESECQRLLH